MSSLVVHMFLNVLNTCSKTHVLKYLANFEVIFMFLIFFINSLLKSIHASRANIDIHNFTNCSYYHIALVDSNFEKIVPRDGE